MSFLAGIRNDYFDVIVRANNFNVRGVGAYIRLAKSWALPPQYRLYGNI